MTIRSVGAEFFHAVGQADGWQDRRRDRNDEAKKVAFGNFESPTRPPLVKMACRLMQHSDISNNFLILSF